LFGSYTDQSSEFYSDLLIILQQVIEASDFNGSDRYEAQKLSENFRKFETISMAFTFIRIFDITTPVSDYQTSGLNIMQAWRMINKATENVEKISRDFSGIFETAFNFVVYANLKLQDVNISAPKSFSTIKSSRSAPEGITNQKINFEVSYHNAVTDVVLSCMRARFSSLEKLYKQISCFDPNRFSEILKSPQNVELGLIANAVPEIDRVARQGDLISFALSYKDLNKGLLENMNDIENDSDSLESEEEYTEVAESSAKTTCKNCSLSCAFTLISEYRLCAAAYENLYAPYKFIVTLSVTQCTCETCFSKQRLLKTRLRTSLTQNNLESLMLVAIEKDIAMKIKSNKDKIIDKTAESSADMSTMSLL